MNRLGFFKGQVYDWGWFQNTDSHSRTKITPRSLYPQVKNFSISVYVNCVQLYSLLQVVLIMHIFFAQIPVKPLFSHLHKAGFSRDEGHL